MTSLIRHFFDTFWNDFDQEINDHAIRIDRLKLGLFAPRQFQNKQFIIINIIVSD